VGALSERPPPTIGPKRHHQHASLTLELLLDLKQAVVRQPRIVFGIRRASSIAILHALGHRFGLDRPFFTIDRISKDSYGGNPPS
jgi:hypothetical protein